MAVIADMCDATMKVMMLLNRKPITAVMWLAVVVCFITGYNMQCRWSVWYSRLSQKQPTMQVFLFFWYTVKVRVGQVNVYLVFLLCTLSWFAFPEFLVFCFLLYFEGLSVPSLPFVHLPDCLHLRLICSLCYISLVSSPCPCWSVCCLSVPLPMFLTSLMPCFPVLPSFCSLIFCCNFCSGLFFFFKDN